MKTKTRKTPLMTAEAYGWMVLNKNRKNTTTVGQALRALVLPSDFPCESKLSQIKSALHPHSTNLGPLQWKNPASLKNHFSQCRTGIGGCAAGFLGFSFFKCEIPEGLMVGLQALHRGACSPGESMLTQHQRRLSHTWRKGFILFLFKCPLAYAASRLTGLLKC